VWWIALADEIRPREGVPWQQMFAAIQKVFNFAEVPTKLPLPGQGYEFGEGSLKDGEALIAVNKLSIFNDGLNIQVPTDTGKAEQILQAAIEIFFSLGLREPVTPPLHYYLSNIVVDFEKSLDGFIHSPILKIIAAAMPAEGNAHFCSLRVNFDPSTLPPRLGPINPTNFLIERRMGVPYDQNRYFCQANTTTEKHILLLQQIEKSI
jgi:hypothetical protein